MTWTGKFGNMEQKEAPRSAQILAVWFWQQMQCMLGEDLAVDHARRRAAKTRFAAVGQQEAQERHTKQHKNEKARPRKREWRHIQRGAWVKVGEYPDLWSTKLSLIPREDTTGGRSEPLGADGNMEEDVHIA